MNKKTKQTIVNFLGKPAILLEVWNIKIKHQRKAEKVFVLLADNKLIDCWFIDNNFVYAKHEEFNDDWVKSSITQLPKDLNWDLEIQKSQIEDFDKW